MTGFARMTTPIYPIMDNMYLDTFFFYVPNRLVWNHWVNFMGEQPLGPGDSISYTIPTMTSPVGGYLTNSVQDYMGLPCTGQVGGGNTVTHSALPLRCYHKIYNDWFRDENLQNAAWTQIDDGPDLPGNYAKLTRGKRHDNFTSCLPWVQKFTAPSVPLGTSAPVRGIGFTHPTGAVASGTTGVFETGGGSRTYANNIVSSTTPIIMEVAGSTTTTAVPTIFADLTAATSATINQLRQSFQVQKLLERDARGGTRYTEIIRSHFGVISPDARLQRIEYLGGGTVPVNIAPIAQTTATCPTGGQPHLEHYRLSARCSLTATDSHRHSPNTGTSSV